MKPHDDLGFVHVFVPAERPTSPTLLLLHGTGGDERDLLPLGRELWPGAALLGIRGKVLENGRMVHDLYLFEVKKPSESKKPWDYYKQIAVVPGDKAFFTAKESGCPLTK